jgi:hypothetical protein
MLEFVVPEPAAMYRHSLVSKSTNSQGKAKPKPPMIGGAILDRPSQIFESNYGPLLSLYGGVQFTDAPPLPFVTVSKAFAISQEETKDKTAVCKTDTIEVPKDYVATWADVVPVACHTENADIKDWFIQIGVGHDGATWKETSWEHSSFSLDSITTPVPVSVYVYRRSSALAHVTVTCRRTDSSFAKWQISVFQAVMEAYKRELDKYEGSEVAKGIQIQGQAPDANREIERTELKRWCIEFLRRQQTNFGSMQEPTSAFPYIQFDRAFAEGGIAQFFKQAFEWEQLTYLFYPYMWAKQQRWVDMVAQNDADPLFKRFLAAGFARCVAPVRPGYEKALMYFLKTGEIWEGGEPPTINDPLYVSIVDSLKELDHAPDEGVPEGDPWEVKLPTSLVMLDDKPELPDWTNELQKPQSNCPYYEPSEDTCDGEHYNLKLWPKDGFAIYREYRLLGYDMPDTGNPIADMATAGGKLLIQSFQRRIKQIKAALKVTPTGVNDACTLVALTFARELRINGQWPGTWGPIS